MKRACSEFYFFRLYWLRFRDEYFLRRGYDPAKVDRAFKLVKSLSRVELLAPGKPKRIPPGRVPFIVPFATNTTHITDVLEQAAAMPMARAMFMGCSFELPQKVTYKVGANLKRQLVRASFQPSCAKLRGSWCCMDPRCPVCSYIKEDTVTYIEKSPEVFNLQHHITCETRNVVYVVICKRCNVLGVGECENPKKRLVHYIRAAAKLTMAPTAVIEQHFTDLDHTILDLEFQFLDCIPDAAGAHPACYDTERARLEEIWITKLRASMNVKRHLRNSFSGHGRARNDPTPAIDDSQPS